MTTNGRGRKRSPPQAKVVSKTQVTKENAREVTEELHQKLMKFRQRMSESKPAVNLQKLRKDIEGLKKASETSHGKERDDFTAFVTEHREVLRCEYGRLCEQVKEQMMTLKNHKEGVADVVNFWRFKKDKEFDEEPFLKMPKKEEMTNRESENKENEHINVSTYVNSIRQCFNFIREECKQRWKDLIECQELYVLVRQKYIQVTAQNLKEGRVTVEEWDTVLSEAVAESQLVQKKARAVKRF